MYYPLGHTPHITSNTITFSSNPLVNELFSVEGGEELTCLTTLECCSVHVPAELKLPVNYLALLFYGSSCVFKTLINQGLLGICLLCKAGQVLNCEC